MVGAGIAGCLLPCFPGILRSHRELELQQKSVGSHQLVGFIALWGLEPSQCLIRYQSAKLVIQFGLADA
jgi:hypothetical protein